MKGWWCCRFSSWLVHSFDQLKTEQVKSGELLKGWNRTCPLTPDLDSWMSSQREGCSFSKRDSLNYTTMLQHVCVPSELGLRYQRDAQTSPCCRLTFSKMFLRFFFSLNECDFRQTWRVPARWLLCWWQCLMSTHYRTLNNLNTVQWPPTRLGTDCWSIDWTIGSQHHWILIV